MAKDKASIYVECQNLFGLLYDAQFRMNKRDRPVIGNSMLSHCEGVLSHFAVAYKVEDKDVPICELVRFNNLRN